MDDSKAAATAFLTSLLCKTLRITTTDTRLFVGEFRCTDADRNIILSHTHEYRIPSAPPPTSGLAPPHLPSASTTTPAASSAPASAADAASPPTTAPNKPAAVATVIQDMTSRYLGLVVVPGEFITKVEVEDFASQARASGGPAKYAALAAGLVGS